MCSPPPPHPRAVRINLLLENRKIDTSLFRLPLLVVNPPLHLLFSVVPKWLAATVAASPHLRE